LKHSKCFNPARFVPEGAPKRVFHPFENKTTKKIKGSPPKVWIEKQPGVTYIGLSYPLFARTAESKAPAPPRSASTAVGFSGESVHPVCAWSGTVTSIIAAPINMVADFVIVISLCNAGPNSLSSEAPGFLAGPATFPFA
jgi:hypothetical protein